MKKNEKRIIIISTICSVIGLIGVIYTKIIENTLSYEVFNNMYMLGMGYIILGIVSIIYTISLSKNKKKSQEKQNIYDDERVNINKNRACTITFKITLAISLIANYVVTFFFTQYSELANTLGYLICGMILIYSVVYYFVSKNN